MTDLAPDLSATRTRLQSSLAELETRLTHIARDLSDTPDRDWEEQAIELEDDEALEHQAALVEAEIVSVKRALERINKGTYGECVQCGEQISPARLQARPEAALCIDCANNAA